MVEFALVILLKCTGTTRFVVALRLYPAVKLDVHSMEDAQSVISAPAQSTKVPHSRCKKQIKKFQTSLARFVQDVLKVESTTATLTDGSCQKETLIIFNGGPSSGVSPFHLRLWLQSLLHAMSTVHISFGHTSNAAIVTCDSDEGNLLRSLWAFPEAVHVACTSATTVVAQEFLTDLDGMIGLVITPPADASIFFSTGSSADATRDLFFCRPAEAVRAGLLQRDVMRLARSLVQKPTILGIEHLKHAEVGASDPNAPRSLTVETVLEIPGIFVVRDFISQNEHDQILRELRLTGNAEVGDVGPSPIDWEVLARRRVAHYNRRFYYGSNHLGEVAGKDLGQNQQLPRFYEPLRLRLAMQDPSVVIADKSASWPVPETFLCDQLTINHYPHSGDGKSPGGIAHHVDAHRPFDDIIFSLSLKSHTVMEFKRWDETRSHVGIFLPPMALLIMTGEARYGWTHCIAENRMDFVSDEVKPMLRGDRVSLTWRMGRVSEHFCDECPFPSLCDAPPRLRQLP